MRPTLALLSLLLSLVHAGCLLSVGTDGLCVDDVECPELTRCDPVSAWCVLHEAAPSPVAPAEPPPPLEPEPPPPADQPEPPPEPVIAPPPPPELGDDCLADAFATFEQQGLPASFSCASCHMAGEPSGSGISWGPASRVPGSFDWFEASVALDDRDRELPVNQRAIFSHFAGVNGTHPDQASARDAMAVFLAVLGGCRDPAE